ncbi:dethiobiotin synthase [Phenylobacterium sp.]|uniref:dethiobiotin synthase n=1 Tax=Phenylobacterium sp. TaxID=1871053 RepID=UPI00286B0829|nr:dethiobiotin synthase [Phenylobacterium sp.]
MRGLSITGAHTDVGKTYVACALIRAAVAQGRRVGVLKPVVSGFDPNDWAESDPGRLLRALGLAPTEALLDAVSPLRFRAPLSPPMAARAEGRTLAYAEVVEACAPFLADTQADFKILEGAGGVMSPIAEDGLCAHLHAEAGLPAVLVGGSYLGAISHTLTAIAALQGFGIPLHAVVISQSPDPDAPDFEQTVESVERFANLPVVAARRGEERWARELL